jgi:hypothetical protein
MSKLLAFLLTQTAYFGLATLVTGQQLPEEPAYRKDVIPNDPGWSLGPTAFETTDGSIMLVWTGGKPGSGEDSKLPLWKSTSSDLGRTWTKAEVFYGEKDWGMFNPISIALANGDILVAYNPYQYPYLQLIDAMRSIDGGRTWSKPDRIDTGSKTTATRGPVVLTSKGRLLLPYYWEASVSQDKGPEVWNGSCMISDDNGISWSKGGDMPHWNHPRGDSEPTIAEFSDGTLYALLRTSEACQYQSISRDGGKTWSAPAPSPFASPCSCAILTKLRSGRVLLVWNNIATMRIYRDRHSMLPGPKTMERRGIRNA